MSEPIDPKDIDLRRMLSEIIFSWTRDGKHDVNDPTLPDYLLWELRSTLEFPAEGIRHLDAENSLPGTAAARWEFSQKIVDRFLAGELPSQAAGKMDVPGQPGQSVTVHRKVDGKEVS